MAAPLSSGCARKFSPPADCVLGNDRRQSWIRRQSCGLVFSGVSPHLIRLNLGELENAANVPAR